MKLIKEFRLTDAEQTVWIFGAGASAPDPYGVPTQAALLTHFAKMDRPGGKVVQKRLEDLKDRVRKHCKQVLPGLDMSDPSVTLEEVFSAFELAAQDPRSSRAEVTDAQDAFDDLVQALRLATYVFGRGDAGKWKPHDRGGVSSPYAELLEKLLPAGSKGPVAHTLITFNYDVNLDRCLINLRGSAADYDVDYGIALANSRCPDAPEFDPPPPDRSVLLLRTHGALNWIRCRACRSIFTTLGKQQEIPEDLKCYACGKLRMDYVLVHPSYFRRYDDPVLQLIWGRSYEELVRAERWVFVGYSLPPADVHFRELLRDALRVRNERAKATSVVLVGRGPVNTNEFKALVRSYEAMFSTGVSAWEATAGGFGDFVGIVK
jgi:hypothetical protein